MCPMSWRRARGFTLIELVIVVAIIAILVAVAYPSYQRHVLHSYRAQAEADLVEYAGLAERYHTANNGYVLAGTGSGFTLPATQSPRDTSKTRYTLSLQAGQDSFTITATPTGSQLNDSCGTLSLNQAGVKTASGGTVDHCW